MEPDRMIPDERDQIEAPRNNGESLSEVVHSLHARLMEVEIRMAKLEGRIRDLGQGLP